MMLADRFVMDPNRADVATVGDLADLEGRMETRLQDLEDRFEKRLMDLEERLEDRLTRSLSMELGRVANVIMEHTTSLIRAAGDHPKAIEERLDAHVADQSVHLRPSRA